MPALLQSYQLYVSEVCCNVDAVRQWDGKILTKIRARQRSTIGKNRLLIVLYNGERGSGHSFFVVVIFNEVSINKMGEW
jgi:hypothetical protein